MNIVIRLLCGAAALSTAGIALAQAVTMAGPAPAVTRQQVVERTDRAFAVLDANHDGRVTPDEARQQRRALRGDMLFDRLDADDNDSVSREEMRAAQADRGDRRGRGHGGRGHGGRGGGGGMRGLFAGGDGAPVTQAAFRDRALARFDAADLDRDGSVTREERRQARAQHRADVAPMPRAN
jgi:Ca2+-binding EF-hand superfamily protein